MEMLRPTPYHHRLHALAGDWEGEERFNRLVDGSGVAVGRMSSRMGVDGLYLIEDYVREEDGVVMFHGHGILGWDPESGMYTSYWVDSMGFPSKAPARGRWEGDTLTLVTSSPGSDIRYTYRLEGDDTYYFSVDKSVDGGHTWRTGVEAIYRRK